MVKECGFRMRLLPVLCLVLPLLAGCDEKKQAAAPQAPAVGVRPVAMRGVSQSFEFVGHIKATDKVDVRARVEGFIEKVAFREGQDVKAGDLLYQLEQPPFQAQVNTAKASVTQFEAQYRNAQVTLERARAGPELNHPAVRAWGAGRPSASGGAMNSPSMIVPARPGTDRDAQ